ncbi:MAG TPA: hypothetical protein PKV97_17645, partial [Thauera aminoaromatica]|nr:hypothetical protein [Thauera aminoaromatica]
MMRCNMIQFARLSRTPRRPRSHRVRTGQRSCAGPPPLQNRLTMKIHEYQGKEILRKFDVPV